MGRSVLKDCEEAEQSAAVVPKANTTSWTWHTSGATRLGTRCVDMKLRIYQEKLALISHIKSMDEKSLASQIYREQLEKGWPGLAKEAKEICEELEIEDINTSTLTKSEFKRLTKGAIKTKNEAILKEMAHEKSKCKNIMKKD